MHEYIAHKLQNKIAIYLTLYFAILTYKMNFFLVILSISTKINFNFFNLLFYLLVFFETKIY